MWRSILPVLLLALVFASGCTPAREAGTLSGSDLIFSRDVLPVLQMSFAPLLTQDPGLNFDSWENLIRGSERGEILIPFDAERSVLVEVAEHAGADGPTDAEIELVRRWIDLGARSDDGAIPYERAERLLYVCNQGSAVISVIDMDANLVIRTIDLQDLGFSENARPHHVAVSPDGSYWYVSLIGENTILKFNPTNELIGRVEFEVPGMLSIDPDERHLYVGRSMSAVNPPHRIGSIDRSEMQIEEVDVFYSRPHAIETAPNGRYVYSASLAVNQIAGIDTETYHVEVIDVPGPHHSFVQFAIAPDGQTMITGGEMSGQLVVFDLSEPMTPTVKKTIDLGGAPWHPVFSPDGRYAYVPRKQADAVSVIDMQTLAQTGVIEGRGLSQPHGSAVRSDGRYLYVSNNNLDGAYSPRYDVDTDPIGTVAVIDTHSNRIVKVLEVENYPTGIGARPNR